MSYEDVELFPEMMLGQFLALQGQGMVRVELPDKRPQATRVIDQCCR